MGITEKKLLILINSMLRITEIEVKVINKFYKKRVKLLRNLIQKFNCKRGKNHQVSRMLNQPINKIEIDKNRFLRKIEISYKIFQEVQVKKVSNFLTAKDHQQLGLILRLSLKKIKIVDKVFNTILHLKKMCLQRIFPLQFIKNLLNKILMN